MPLALGLFFVLPIVGALHRSHELLRTGHPERPSGDLPHGISVTRILRGEGRIERLLKWKGVCTRETIVDRGYTKVALREVSLREDGKKLRLMYEGDALTECTETDLIAEDDDDDKDDCRLNRRNDDDSEKEAEGRTSERLEVDAENSSLLRWFVSKRDLRDRCAIFEKRRARVRSSFSRRKRISQGSKNAAAPTSRTRRFGDAQSRERREILLIPGTRWCGRGNRASKYTSLGGFGKADACCRRHDTACPFYIPAFDSRYGLFNWGISTMMHCTCDERFRTCLKMAGTSSANFIGRIFFNVVQTKCFVLKPRKVCTRRSWWGKCEKHEYKKQASIRDNVPY